MKARVKATGRVIEVMNVMDEEGVGIWEDMSDVSICPTKYHNYELEFIDLPKDLQHNIPDYWEKLKHQYAGMAMQAYIIASHIGHFGFGENDVADCESFATALVNKLKGE